MNAGKYVEDVKEARPTDFQIGVAGYPEVHAEAMDLHDDVTNLKRKITFWRLICYHKCSLIMHAFSNLTRYVVRWTSMCLIPGIKVITSKRQVEVLPEILELNYQKN